MSAYETVTLGRSKRSTAGNRMRELLEKAHQDDKDEIFAEVEGDDEFEAPQEQRDVYLDEFADTDEEVEEDEEATERALQREERQKAKGKTRAIYNPLANQPKPKKTMEPPSASTSALAALDPSIDTSAMAPSTLMLTLRKQRREAKRLGRSEARRSNLRASTLKTEEEIKAREEAERANRSNKGRRPQHETGEVRGSRPMTQDELIAAALEEEERNKEALRDWLRKEDEKRELRRVGRKRVKGPRWTWVSRTVGKLVEVVDVPEPLVPSGAVSKATVDAPAAACEGTAAIESDAISVDQPQASTAAVAVPPLSEGQVAVDTSPSDDAAVPSGSEPPGPSKDAAASVVVQSQISSNPPDLEAVKPDEASSVAQTSQSPRPEQFATATPALAAASEAQAKARSEPAPAPTPTTVSGNAAHAAERPAPISTTQETPQDNVLPPSNPGVNLATPLDGPPPQTQANASDTPSNQPEPIKSSTALDPPAPSPPQPTAEDPAQYTRNYLILSQIPGGLPAELKLVLGDHVDWDEVAYIPARNRPITRRPPACPLTGLPAKYRHPDTMIPYATVEGYKTIEAMLANRYMYDEGGWWAGGEEDDHAEGMEGIDGWWEAIHGGWLGGKEIPVEQVVAPAEVEEEVMEEEVMEEEVEVVKGKRKRGKASASATPVPSSKRSKGKRIQTELHDQEPNEPEPVIEAAKKSKTRSRKR
ncbi:hypothetical protein IAU60_003226 [Kwoniella sp. DSM 27419]